MGNRWAPKEHLSGKGRLVLDGTRAEHCLGDQCSGFLKQSGYAS
ncbi:hypothetical protein HMPREF1556_00430 [Porphyromonas sp. oral taxon 278 str. W7784]|nr:hypothetical protein HMPREF1556_00430 [Porphyromonas sp. oral taxon 278 str. W7784]